jgi:macrolide transport system ATP-binding/permease protein
MDVLGKAAWWLRRVRCRLRRDRLDDELRDEIAQHIEERRRQLIADGMDPRDAAYEARRMFGNVTRIREETREMWTLGPLDTLMQDVRFGARLLRRSPVFTLAAVASLAIGIGSAAAVFSLADELLFRELPVRDPKQLVLFRWISGPRLPFTSMNGYGQQTDTESSSTSFALKAFDTIRERLAGSADVIGFASLYTINMSIGGQPDTVSAHVVSGNYFSALGLQPAAGRLLTPADDRPGAPLAAVIGYDLWQRRFGGSPGAIGQTIVLNGIPFEIAGVMPKGFHGTNQVAEPCDVMVPLTTYAAVTRRVDEDPADPNFWWVLMMARLKPGVSPEQIQPVADLVVKQTVSAARPDHPADQLPRVRVEPGSRGQVESRASMREPFTVMAGVVAIVLLAACANVANLLLARGRARAREIAVRSAIGASRHRIVRQLVTEGLLLGVIACGAGLFMAKWISAAILPALTGSTTNQTIQYTLDARIVAFTCALGVVCTVLFALWPAWRAATTGVAMPLREGGHGSVTGAMRLASGGALVVAQVALSLLLLSAATLLAWSAHRLRSVDPGFDAQNLLTFTVDPALNGYEPAAARTYVARALDALRALPGVVDATASSHRLISNSSSITVARAEGVAVPPLDAPEARTFIGKNRAWRLTVADRFFETFRIPILRGNRLPETLRPDGPQVAVVNEALARQLFGTTDAIGRRFYLGLQEDATLVEVVGVAANARYTAMRSEPPPTVYIPYQQAAPERMTFAVRTAGDPMNMAAAVRDAMRRIDDTLPLFALRTQDEQIARSLARETLFAKLALLLGGITLALAGIGLYGVLAYSVTRRTAEIGVRMALGALSGQVRWMVIRQSLVLVGIGIVLGIPAARMTSSYLESLLFGLSPYDPRALGIAAIVLLIVGFAAASIPARRAARIDPLTALRTE